MTFQVGACDVMCFVLIFLTVEAMHYLTFIASLSLGYWHQQLLGSFWAKGLHMDYSIVPFHSNVDFVGTTVGLAALNTWAIGEVCHPNFLLKWHIGKLRPEEGKSTENTLSLSISFPHSQTFTLFI